MMDDGWKGHGYVGIDADGLFMAAYGYCTVC